MLCNANYVRNSYVLITLLTNVHFVTKYYVIFTLIIQQIEFIVVFDK